MSNVEESDRLFASRTNCADASREFLEEARSLIVRGMSLDGLAGRVMRASVLSTSDGVYTALSLLADLTTEDDERKRRCVSAARDRARYHAAERAVAGIAGWPIFAEYHLRDAEDGFNVGAHAVSLEGPLCRDLTERFAVGRLLAAERHRQCELLRPDASAAYDSEFVRCRGAFKSRLEGGATLADDGRSVLCDGVVIAKKTYGVGDLLDGMTPTTEGLALLGA